jgi:hypothetical protein
MPIMSRPKRFCLRCAVLACLLAPLREARAQDRDPAAAQALFDQARQLVRQRKFDEACSKFAESNRLDPGIGTQFHLADCYEKATRIASAWATFLDVASQARAAGQPERERAALKRAQKLEPRLPRLVLDVPEASRVPGLEIRRNGVQIGAAQWGTPVPVDPGEIKIVASAPGKQPLEQALRLEEGKTASFEVPALAAEKGGAAQPPGQAPTQDGGAGTDGAEVTDNGAPERDSGAERGGPGPLFYALAGVGVVGLGVGASFALMAKSKNEDSKAYCDPQDPNQCNSEGVEMRNDALTKGNIATVGAIVGSAAVTGAVLVLLLDAGKPREQQGRLRSSAALGPDRGVVYVQGNF